MKSAKINTRKLWQVLFVIVSTVAVYFIVDTCQIMVQKRVCANNKLSPLTMVFTKTDTRWPPSILKPKIEHCNVYDMKAKNNHHFNCITTKTTPPVPICIHDLAKDGVISGILVRYGNYDDYVGEEVREALKNDPEMGLIDIGANIGVMVLPIAKSGHKVVAVEPIMDNILRLHKSAQLANTTDKIILVHNGLAAVRSWGKSNRNPTNLGGTAVELGTGPRCTENCHIDVVDTIYMDDLLEVISFKKAVIKMDCEGCEIKALSKGEKVLDQVDVKMIQMEWGHKIYSQEQERKDDIKKIIKMLMGRGYIPRSVKGERYLCDLDPAKWMEWPHNVVWYKIQDTR